MYLKAPQTQEKQIFKETRAQLQDKPRWWDPNLLPLFPPEFADSQEMTEEKVGGEKLSNRPGLLSTQEKQIGPEGSQKRK